jgi:chromosome segregation ATPase
MSSDSTTEARWPVLKERAPFVQATLRPGGRKLPRSAWLLTGLAFLCGGLVSAAGFSIGWRHQAQRDTAAQTALAAATARTHTLERRIAALQASLNSARSAKAQARAAAAAAAASQNDLARAAAKVGDEAAASGSDAASISSGAGSLSGSATRIASELKTLDTYLTTTPVGQLDPGYIASQTAYLNQRLTRLEADAGGLDASVTSFKATLRKLSREAAALKAR